LKLADEVFGNMWTLAETAATGKLPQRTRSGSGCYRRTKGGAARASEKTAQIYRAFTPVRCCGSKFKNFQDPMNSNRHRHIVSTKIEPKFNLTESEVYSRLLTWRNGEISISSAPV